jgi:hypothetical protein
MIRQLSVFIENIPGSLMQVTKCLKESGINLMAISSFDSPEFGILRMIVDQPERAEEILKENHFMVRVGTVLGVSVADEPGALNKMLEIMAQGNISVNYIYSFISEIDRAPIMIFHTEYTEEARQLLTRNGMHVVDNLKEL